jgi:hypothetical protein
MLLRCRTSEEMLAMLRLVRERRGVKGKKAARRFGYRSERDAYVEPVTIRTAALVVAVVVRCRARG